MLNYPYSVLNLSSDTPFDVCKKKYRLLCIKYHPDSLNGDIIKFNELQKAWGLIKMEHSQVVNKKRKTHLTHFDMFNFIKE